MNRLLKNLLAEEKKICIFPIREYWIDIGNIEDFQQAQHDYGGVFL